MRRTGSVNNISVEISKFFKQKKVLTFKCFNKDNKHVRLKNLFWCSQCSHPYTYKQAIVSVRQCMKEIETKKGILHLGAYLDAYLATN